MSDQQIDLPEGLYSAGEFPQSPPVDQIAFGTGWELDKIFRMLDIERVEREIGYDVRQPQDYEAYETMCRILRNMRRCRQNKLASGSQLALDGTGSTT
jgi:hypothetical protein